MLEKKPRIFHSPEISWLLSRTTNYAELPPLSHHPAHVAVVSTLARLRQTQREGFFSRITRSHTAAIFLREVLY